MKIKFLLLITTVLTLSLLLCSCNKNEAAKEKRTLNVYNWGEYISNEDDAEYGLIDVNKAFEIYCKDTLGYEVKVNYSTYATNEDMYSKLKNGAVKYDIVIPSDYMIQKMISEGMLKAIDVSNLSNYSNINEKILEKARNSYDYDPTHPENTYSVPYTYGMLGIIYNKNYVSEQDVAGYSWDLLWNANYKGKILQFNNPRDAFATAMYKESLDVNSHNPEDWNMALDELIKQKPLLQGYVNDEIFNKMKGNSAYIAPYFAGDYLTMASDNNALRFYYPSEGTNYFVDAMCIPEKSENEDLAMEYINFMLSLEIGRANALYIGYATPNEAVKNDETYQALLSDSYDIVDDDDTVLVDAYKTLYEIETGYLYTSYANYYKGIYEGDGPYNGQMVDIQSHVNSLWEKLKIESSTEPWIHVTSIAIVVGVLSLATYSVYIKKKRSRDYRLRDKMKQIKK